MAKRIGLHILFWVAILYWRANGDYLTKIPFEKFVIHNLIRMPLVILATYSVIYYMLPKFVIREKRYFIFGYLLALTLLLATFLDQVLIRSELMKMALQPASKVQLKWLLQLHPYRNSFLLMAIIGIASLIRFFKVYQQQEKRKNQLIQEKLETQYAFFKAQVNPHFLFNALNNIYSMAIQQNQQEIAQGLENLSGIMQYLTYESNAKQVPLSKEIELLKNYIEVEQLRFANTDDITISFHTTGALASHQIAPVILLPLVENAFKHGVKPEQSCLISIQLSIKKDALFFHIQNTRFDFSAKEMEHHGIGLQNVRKRLELRYPGIHALEVKEAGDYFFTDLKIQLT